MIFYYLDASVWVKRYYQEKGTSWVQDVFNKNQRVACASLGFIEVIATLSRKCKAGEISISLLTRKAQDVENDWDRFIQVQMTAEVVGIAKDCAKNLVLRGADAVHLSSALLLQRRLRERDDRLILVSSDHELKEAASLSRIEAIDPEEQER